MLTDNLGAKIFTDFSSFQTVQYTKGTAYAHEQLETALPRSPFLRDAGATRPFFFYEPDESLPVPVETDDRVEKNEKVQLFTTATLAS